MRRLAVIGALVVGIVAAPGAAADTVTQQPTPWTAAPFTSFSPGLITSDATGHVYTLATGPSSTTYIAGFDPATGTRLISVGGGNGFVQIALPANAHPETIVIQGTQLVVAGSAPGGAFVQAYSLGDGTSAGPTIVNAPGGTSFTADGGNASPAAGGGARIVIAGLDTISLSPMLFTTNVTGGVLGPSSLCPHQFNVLTGGPFATSSVATNAAGQIMLGGVEVPSPLPAVAAVNTACSALTTHGLTQPGGQANDGFVTAVNGLPSGNFVVGTDMSAGSGAAIEANLVSPMGVAVPGTTPYQGPSVPSAHVAAVFPFGTGAGLIGTQRTSVPVPGTFIRFDATGHVVQAPPTTFTDSHNADVVPQAALPIGNAVSIVGLGSPATPPNTLDVWKALTTASPPPPCTPKLKVRKRLETWAVLRWKGTKYSAPTGLPVPGDDLDYVIRVTNEADCVADDVTVDDAFPDGFRPSRRGLIQQEGTFQSFTYSGQAISVHIAHLAPHSSAQILVYGSARLGSLNNHATISASGVTPETTNEVLGVVQPPPQVTHIDPKPDRISGTVVPAKLKHGRVDPIAHVNVAIERDGPHGSCEWLTRTGAFRTAKGGCGAIPWMRAKGTKRFSLGYKRLRPGNYLALVQPVSRRGLAPGVFGLTLPGVELFRVSPRGHR